MKVELLAEKHGANVELRASIAIYPVPGALPGSQDVGHMDIVAYPASFGAHSIERHVRSQPLICIPLVDAKRLARQILNMDGDE